MEHPCSTLPLAFAYLPLSFISFIPSSYVAGRISQSQPKSKSRITNCPINALPIPLAMAKDKDNPPDKPKKLKKALAL
jgi:hypothetical protein